ncbi:hypothetical protein QTP86_001289 [Hemibagrus guttatus]|nr:hypothetical protein QTP86_001289 [Hemibagrus guttatus]
MAQLSEEVRQESPWTMMFADDIVICSESREQVEENLERWRRDVYIFITAAITEKDGNVSSAQIKLQTTRQVFVEFTRVVSKDLERDFFGDIKYSLTAAQTKTSKIMS